MIKNLGYLCCCFFILNCTNQHQETAITSSESAIKDTDHSAKTRKPLETPSQKEDIIATGMSFHKWYIKATNDWDANIPTDFEVTEGPNDTCIINYTPYFEALRQLGTISEAFMDLEKARTKDCAMSIQKLNWSDYIGEIPEGCDDYLYWTNSQDITDGVAFVSLETFEDHWLVEMHLYNKGATESENIFTDRVLKAKVIQQNDQYLIERIDWMTP